MAAIQQLSFLPAVPYILSLAGGSSCFLQKKIQYNDCISQDGKAIGVRLHFCVYVWVMNMHCLRLKVKVMGQDQRTISSTYHHGNTVMWSV